MLGGVLLLNDVATGDSTPFQRITTPMLSWMILAKFNRSHNRKNHEQEKWTNREKNSIDRGGNDQNEPYTCMSKNERQKIILLRIRDLVLSSSISLPHRHSDSVCKIRFGQVVMIL